MALGLRRAVRNIFYGRWPRPRAELAPGYTLLLTVPPDLPVFLHLAIEVCRRQDLMHMVETLVVPDRVDPSFRSIFEAAQRDWPEGRLRLVEMGPVNRLMRWMTTAGCRIHWLQIIAGVLQTRTTHAVLHDVDLFLLDDDFLRTHYEECMRRRLGCLGVDHKWPGEPGLEHLVGCWEMMFDTRWIRSHPPERLGSQHADVNGKRFWFDSTLLAQALSPPEKVGKRLFPFRHIHFQEVIHRYRKFELSRGPFEDERFSLLLTRLLVDQFDASRSASYHIPSLAQLSLGITQPQAPVTYVRPSTAAYYCSTFRPRLERLLTENAIQPSKASAIAAAVKPFDLAFGTHELYRATFDENIKS